MVQLKILFLLFSISGLGAVPILTSWTSTLEVINTEEASNVTFAKRSVNVAIAVDYHLKRGEIYFSDGQGHISRVWLRDGPVKNDPLVIVEVTVVDGLAVDWINENLYWTDVSSKTVEMATLDGLNRRVLFRASDGLDKPRSIVVDPSEGLLFWSDWGGNRKVFSSGLNGKEKRSVASNFFWPNGLTLDLSKKKLYILEGLFGTLSSCNYDGSNMQELLSSLELVQQGFGLTYFANKLYWSSWKEGALISMNTATKQAAAIYKPSKGGLLQRPMGVKAIHPSLQPDVPKASVCNDKHCSHQCVLGPQGTSSCICPFGFVLGPDEKTCTEKGYILLSWRRTIRRYNLEGNNQQQMMDASRAAISIDVHLHRNLVFWSDIEEHRIYRAPLEQLNNKTVVVTVETCDGLAIDWVHDVLYWTDVNRNILEAASLDGSNRTAVVTEDLDQPRAIALDPAEGLMFWSDWGSNPKIENAALDGSNRKTIVKEKIGWPNGIAIDFDQKRIYWTDGMLKTISSCLYDGSQRTSILGPQIVSLQPFGISVYEGSIYWTDWAIRGIMKSPKTSYSSTTLILANSSSLFLRPNGVRVVHSSLQKKHNNPCIAMNCKSLCLGSPNDRKARCMTGETVSDIKINNVTESSVQENELDNMVINVKNDSFQISFRSTKDLNFVLIMLKCEKREGCLVDARCSEQDWVGKSFHVTNLPFTVTGLLPASRYKVKMHALNNVQVFHITTKHTDPPELPRVNTVVTTSTNVTVTWDPIDTCVPHFEAYNFKVYKEGESELVFTGSTNTTKATVSNLQPAVSYTMHLFTFKPNHFVTVDFITENEEEDDRLEEKFDCNCTDDCLDKRNKAKAVKGVELTVYKKTKSDVHFRCTVSNKTAVQLEKICGSYNIAGSDLNNKFETSAVPCRLWPDSYCFNISRLESNKMYSFHVSAMLQDGTGGFLASASVVTKEGVPGPPEDLHIVNYSPTNVEIEWRHPNESNGVIRSFVINIQEVETFEEGVCCQPFPMTETPVHEEEIMYSAKPGGFSPASSYAISITSKTLYLGGSKEIDVHTPPPPMDILRMPELEVSSLTPISWNPRDDTVDKSSQYHSLIKSYLLLLINPKGNQLTAPIPVSDVGEIPYKSLLEAKIGGEFSVLWNKQSDDAQAFKEPIKIVGLTSRKQYELVWVQVSQYKDAYGLDVISSDPFIAV